MTTEPTRYPLAWPPHKPRTGWSLRKRGQFRAEDKPITRANAMKRLLLEIDRLGASYPLVSTNLELRKDGQPRLDAREPADPGIAVYFTLKGKPLSMATCSPILIENAVLPIDGRAPITTKLPRCKPPSNISSKSISPVCNPLIRPS